MPMSRLAFLTAMALLLAACGVLPVTSPDTGRLAPGQLGGASSSVGPSAMGPDPDVTAVNLAQWAFADAGRTYGRPVEAARAAAAMDYIAGELSTSPRWANIPALTQMQLLQGRREVREALFVAPEAQSQAVIDSLTAAADALARADEPAALRSLGAPVFTVPSQQVLARLNNMPYLRMANVSTMRAANSLFEPGDFNWH